MGVFSLPKNFHWEDATGSEAIFIHAAFGFVIGFGILTGRSAWKQTSVMRNPWKSKFAWLVWSELVINWISSLYNLLALTKTIPPSFGMFLGVNILWGALTMIMLQILCNRVATIEMVHGRAKKITWGVFAIWSLVIIAIFVIWTPAKMQISTTWININRVWNRVEKGIYVLLDLGLNIYFIRSVKKRLVNNGIHKYSRLVKFNIKLICISIAMDVALIGLMSLPQPIAYMSQIGVSYMVKLNIELSLAELLLIIAREPTVVLNIKSHEKISMWRSSNYYPDHYAPPRTTASRTINTRTENPDESDPEFQEEMTVIASQKDNTLCV